MLKTVSYVKKLKGTENITGNPMASRMLQIANNHSYRREVLKKMPDKTAITRLV